VAQGTVKWFSQEKGYGFITPDEGGDDLFVHYTEIEGRGFRDLEDGERVSYAVGPGRKGLQAKNVRKSG
jgi:CspA family cold shock protein